MGIIWATGRNRVSGAAKICEGKCPPPIPSVPSALTLDPLIFFVKFSRLLHILLYCDQTQRGQNLFKIAFFSNLTISRVFLLSTLTKLWYVVLTVTYQKSQSWTQKCQILLLILKTSPKQQRFFCCINLTKIHKPNIKMIFVVTIWKRNISPGSFFFFQILVIKKIYKKKYLSHWKVQWKKQKIPLKHLAIKKSKLSKK